MKISGIILLALLFASAATAAPAIPTESLEQWKIHIVIGKMAQEQMFENISFTKVVKIAKKIAPLVLEKAEPLDEIKFHLIISKYAQEHPESFKRFIPKPKPVVPESEANEMWKIHVVIGKMAQEKRFEQLNFGKVIKIAKKIAPLVLEKETDSFDQIKFHLIISKYAQEHPETFKPILPKILRSQEVEKNIITNLLKKVIINGVVHWIKNKLDKSEAQTFDEIKWKVIISKMTQEVEQTAGSETSAKDVIKKIINGIVHFIVKSKQSTDQAEQIKWKVIISKLSPELEQVQGNETGFKDVMKKIIKGIVNFIVKSEQAAEPIDQLKWKVIISKLAQEKESLRAQAPEKNVIGTILKKVIINGVVHWIRQKIDKAEAFLPRPVPNPIRRHILKAEPKEQSAKDVIKKIINGIVHFLVKDQPQRPTF